MNTTSTFDKCFRALIFDEEEEYVAYIEECSKRIAMNNLDYVSWNNRGVALLELGRVDEARKDFETACETPADDATPFLNYADALQKQGNFDKALNAVNRAIQIDCNSIPGYVIRLEISKNLGDSNQAKQDEDKALNLKKSSAWPVQGGR